MWIASVMRSTSVAFKLARKVDDQATAAFMQSFYQRLKDGKGKGDALAETQQEFRNHPIAGWRHPYVWAALQLSGDWGPVKGL